jgi:hypothetical protein
MQPTDHPEKNSTGATASGRLHTTPCRHCGGIGSEPDDLQIEFCRSGPTRGELARLAELSGVSAPMISNVLSGTRTPSAEVLVKLARGLSEWMGEPITVDRVLAIPAVRKKILGR